jgi:hypothetical protein
MVKGDGVVVKRLIAVRGTGLEDDDEEFEFPDDPPLLPWLFEEDDVDVVSGVAGVDDARLMLLGEEVVELLLEEV